MPTRPQFDCAQQVALMSVAGVDGCKSGWLTVTLDQHNQQFGHAIYHHAEALLEATRSCAVVAIDIPIGLTDAGPRRCDQAARALLRRPRSSSVFPAPIRPALAATSRSMADRLSRSIDGRGVPAQAWGIYGRVREIDQALARRPGAQARVREVHPELAFLTINGGQPTSHSKHRPDGLAERLQLIADAFGNDQLFSTIRSAYRKAEASDDDILDALALCHSALRILHGTARVVPESPPLDSTGLRMEILF